MVGGGRVVGGGCVVGGGRVVGGGCVVGGGRVVGGGCVVGEGVWLEEGVVGGGCVVGGGLFAFLALLIGSLWAMYRSQNFQNAQHTKTTSQYYGFTMHFYLY